jgi:ParB family transcriptional regulator, chromosome partitioning protein
VAKPKFTIQPVKTRQAVEGVDRELLGKTVDDGVYPLAMAKEIRLDRLRPDPDQPRHSFDQRRLEELAASIREQGILQPIVVQYVDDGDYFRIVHGERRWRASVLAGAQTIPAIVRQADESSRLLRQLIENIQREDLNDVDRALALRQLKVNLGSPSWDVVAQKVGISKRRVLQLMDTTKLPESVQQDIRNGQLTEKHGRAIKKLPADQQIDFARVIREAGLSGDESLNLAKVVNATPEIAIADAIAQVKQTPSPAASAQAPSGKAQSMSSAAETTADGAATALAAAVDNRLADLAGVPALLDQIDASSVDVVQLHDLLRRIIGRAEALLARLSIEPTCPQGIAHSLTSADVDGASIEAAQSNKAEGTSDQREEEDSITVE